MNTGVQRSSATPFGAWTTTTPAQHVKDRPKKDMLAIMVAHAIPYAATATVAYPEDLIAKIRKAASIGGTRFIHLLAPCPPGWKIASEDAIRYARLAVGSHVFPLLEVEDGRRWRLTVEPDYAPIEDYLAGQGRFRHLAGDAAAIERDQAGRRRALAAAADADTVTMHTILSKDILSADVVRFWIDAPAIARKRRPGQFVIVRSAEDGERIPLTIADADPARGAISLVIQGVGKSTHEAEPARGGRQRFSTSPARSASRRASSRARSVCCIGGGIGTAVVYPIAAGVKADGGRVVEHHRRAHARSHHPRSARWRRRRRRASS